MYFRKWEPDLSMPEEEVIDKERVKARMNSVAGLESKVSLWTLNRNTNT